MLASKKLSFFFHSNCEILRCKGNKLNKTEITIAKNELTRFPFKRLYSKIIFPWCFEERKKTIRNKGTKKSNKKNETWNTYYFLYFANKYSKDALSSAIFFSPKFSTQFLFSFHFFFQPFDSIPSIPWARFFFVAALFVFPHKHQQSKCARKIENAFEVSAIELRTLNLIWYRKLVCMCVRLCW